jgi:lysophospholipase
MASPDLAVLTALGLQERIVDVGPIHARMARWPKGKLSLYPGAEHEVMMERPATRARFFDEASALYDLHL